tara:strand:+ start:415 stop:753 length:339 start_codon:yes stop_codon:yes gene_type:complete
MSSRYENRSKFINANEMYDNTLKKRNVRQLEQYDTSNLKYPDQEQSKNLIIDTHLWSRGDNYTKLAHEVYGDTTYWWVIAHFNQKPLQSEIEFGDTIYIPRPLELVLNYYGV